MEHPYPAEVYSAKNIVVLYDSRDGGFLPSVLRLGTIYAYPEAQVPVILAEYDFLIVPLGYQVSESAASLQAKRLYNGIP